MSLLLAGTWELSLHKISLPQSTLAKLSYAPGVITLNVVWIKREFDAYKLSRTCAHLTITFSEIERDIYEKIVILSYPIAFDAPG